MTGTTTTSTINGTENNLVVLYPSPGMGHLVSMIELATLFIQQGLFVSIPIVDPPYNAGATSEFLMSVSAANPSLSFHRLPPVTLSPGNTSPHHETLTFEVINLSNPSLRDFLRSISPKALVLDFFCISSMDVASELNIPSYIFFTSGASVLCTFLYLPTLHANSEKSFRQLGRELLSIPGIPPLSANHMVVPMLDRDDKAYEGFILVSEKLPYSNGIIVNTFESLEPRAIEAIKTGKCIPPGRPIPPLYTIGPIIKSNEKHEGKECISWLDKQPTSSVLFLCFGSIGRFSSEQLKEIAVGLENSGLRFVWVVRSPPNPKKKFEKLEGLKLDEILPEGFLDRTKDHGFIVKSWAPQMEILNHKSTGGFVTHCGWNSVLEAVTAGVPMVAWPLYAEQWMNKVFLEEMKLAIAVEGYDKEIVVADELERKMRWLMETEGGRELRDTTKKAKEMATKALMEGGESYETFVGLVNCWKGM